MTYTNLNYFQQRGNPTRLIVIFQQRFSLVKLFTTVGGMEHRAEGRPFLIRHLAEAVIRSLRSAVMCCQIVESVEVVNISSQLRGKAKDKFAFGLGILSRLS